MELLINKKKYSVNAHPDEHLLSVLRDELDLTGSKYGCGEGACGACTVLIDGTAVRSCITSVGSAAGKEITTIEGLAENGQLHRVQEAFVRVDVFQCAILCIGNAIISCLTPGKVPQAIRAGNYPVYARQHLSMRDLPQNCKSHSGSRQFIAMKNLHHHTAELSDEFPTPKRINRRRFFHVLGGGIAVTFTIANPLTQQQREILKTQKT